MVDAQADGESRVLVFGTASGLRYAYDDLSGVILPAPEGEAVAARLAKYRQAAEKFRRPPRPWTPERVKAEAMMAPGLQITLIVTERCTLRCRYCVYTGTYEYSRTHGPADMPLETALRGVDYLAELHRQRETRNPGRTPALGFYGGEPLLRFDLIRAAVARAETLGLRCSYNVTTNGTVDDDEVISFMAEKGFSVAVSLDGPSKEHDRNRVFPDGRGSFTRVYGFLAKLREALRRAGRSGPDQSPPLILSCADRATDLGEVCRFFDEEKEMFGDTSGRLSMISPYRTSYYDGWSPEDLRRADESARLLWPQYFSALTGGALPTSLGFRDRVFGQGLRNLLFSLAMDPSPLRGACVPGTRLAIDPEGRLNVCERVNNNYPLGTIDQGLDLDLVAGMMNTLQAYFEEHCRDCNVRRLCSACFAHVLVDGPPRVELPPEFCDETRVSSRRNLGTLFTVLERNPESMRVLMPTPVELERDRIFNG